MHAAVVSVFEEQKRAYLPRKVSSTYNTALHSRNCHMSTEPPQHDVNLQAAINNGIQHEDAAQGFGRPLCFGMHSV